MPQYLLKGTKAQLVEQINQLPGETLEAIVYVVESGATDDTAKAVPFDPNEDMFAEMDAYMSEAGGEVDYSREAIYTRMEGE